MSNPNPPPAQEQIQQAINQVQQPAIDPATGLPKEVTIEGHIYRGETPQELIDQLIKAQGEATRFIKTKNDETDALKQRVMALESLVPKPQVQGPDPAKATQYYEAWAKDPTEANKLALADLLGVPPDRVGPMLRSVIETTSVNTAADEFLSRCPDFPNTQQSAAIMKQRLARRYGNGPEAATADNLELTFHELVREGALVPTALPATGFATEQNNPLPNLRGASAQPNPVTTILAQAQTMPLDQLKEVIERLQMQGLK